MQFNSIYFNMIIFSNVRGYPVQCNAVDSILASRHSCFELASASGLTLLDNDYHPHHHEHHHHQVVPKSWPVDEQGRADGQRGKEEAGRRQSGWFKIMMIMVMTIMMVAETMTIMMLMMMMTVRRWKSSTMPTRLFSSNHFFQTSTLTIKFQAGTLTI